MSFTIQEAPKECQNELINKYQEPRVVLDEVRLIKEYLGFIEAPPEHSDDYELIPDESAGYHYIQDFFSINPTQFPDSLSSNLELRENIFAALKMLSDKEKEIILNLYKLNEDALNRAELAEKYGMKESKVKELETKALKKLNKVFTDSKLSYQAID